MNKRDSGKLHHGLYEVFWKSGGMSLAAVGSRCDGSRWLAPTNWIGFDDPAMAWHMVECVKLIRSGEMIYEPEERGKR
jgi:hypothetical protein